MTAFGYRSIMRTRKGLSDLTLGGEQTKRTTRLARNVIALGTTNSVLYFGYSIAIKFLICVKIK